MGSSDGLLSSGSIVNTAWYDSVAAVVRAGYAMKRAEIAIRCTARLISGSCFMCARRTLVRFARNKCRSSGGFLKQSNRLFSVEHTTIARVEPPRHLVATMQRDFER